MKKLETITSKSLDELKNEFDNNLDKIAEYHDVLQELDDYINKLECLKMEYGRKYDYYMLKKQGFTDEEINNFIFEDSEYIEKIDEYYWKNLKRREYMFGYPANMEDYSYTTQYLRHLESKMYLMNNCGDPYQRGNYRMDSKAIEKNIISMMATNFGLKHNEYWGYITSGGTESNFWGIREGFNAYPQGKLYFSDDTHYSVEKYVYDGENNTRYPYEKIKSDKYGRIKVDELLKTIENDQKAGFVGAILVLTWGTTVRGAVDDVNEITEKLTEKGIPYYCHLDAALFGGIPKNQIKAPFVSNISDLGIDSIAVSMHKFMGTARVNGVLLALSRKNRSVIEYIGQEDSTLLGSRDLLPFSTYQRAKEVLLRRPATHFTKNVDYFEEKLKENNIYYEKFKNSNIFVIKKPNDEICLKYQLASFTTEEGIDCAHIIIFPFHKEEIINELINDIKETK
ncbi:MAG: aminotransferase class V-fold PLP-dependent enzyme [Bacilli bacterium]|nr:aminotransferase class V-fold PLP-dependent enzyme [Bacilli bacterium]